MPYRTAARPELPAPRVRPVELLDRVHRLMDRFPHGLAVLAALVQIACGMAIGLLLLRWV